MEIFFCDVCNESIPLQDLRDSHAVTIRGKIHCRRCKDPARGQPSRKGSNRARRVAATLWMPALVIVLVGGLAYLVVQDHLRAGARERSTVMLRQVRDEVRTIRARLELVVETVDPMRRDLIARGETLAAVSKGLAELREQVAAASGRSAVLAAAVGRLHEPLDRLSKVMETDDPAIRTMKDQLGALARRLDDVETSLQAHEQEGARSSARRNLTRREVLRLEDLEKRLASKDTNTRFEAVYEVLDDRLEEALPFVLPLTEDKDQFVQIGAIKTVGSLGYQRAVPSLVAALDDKDVSVREEALRQLVVLTGRTGLGFDVRAPARERRKAVEAWRRWLAERS